MQRYLSLAAAGEVRRLLQQASDLPRHAETKVALLLFDRRADPSFEEGIVACSNRIHGLDHCQELSSLSGSSCGENYSLEPFRDEVVFLACETDRFVPGDPV